MDRSGRPNIVGAIIWASLIELAASVAHAETPASPQELFGAQQGSKVVLEWRLGEREDAYVTNLGAIHGPGTREVPGSLVTQGGAKAKVRTYCLLRTDPSANSGCVMIEDPSLTRDETGVPGLASFGDILTYKTATPLVLVLGRLHSTLQDTLGFSVNETRSIDGKIVTYVTNVRPLPWPGDGKIAARRSAIMIEVDAQSMPIRYSLRAFVQYRRRAEATWRTDADYEFAHVELLKVKEKLNLPPVEDKP